MKALEMALSEFFDGWERYGLKEKDGTITAISPDELPIVRLSMNPDEKIYIGPAEDVRAYYELILDLSQKDIEQHKVGDVWKPGRFVIEHSPGKYHVWVNYDEPFADPGQTWAEISENTKVVHYDKNGTFEKHIAKPNEYKKPAPVLDKPKQHHEVVSENLISQLLEGSAPWQRFWEDGNYLPYNPVTGKRYKAINAMHLLSQGREDPRWLTYKQAQSVGAQVRSGEKGAKIQFWRFGELIPKHDANGAVEIDSQGNVTMEEVAFERPQSFLCTVFNAEQVDGLPPLQVKIHDPLSAERAENIIGRSGAHIIDVRDSDLQPHYSNSQDTVFMPSKDQFTEIEKYYSLSFQGLSHWTGHETRLNRDMSNPFGSVGHAKQVLRANISALLLGSEAGVGYVPERSGSYSDAHANILKDDPFEIFRAAADAEKIVDYLLSFEQRQRLEEKPVMNEYEAELSRLLELSTLAPAQYTPSNAVKNGEHSAVFIDGQPIILCGSIDDARSVKQSDDLAANPMTRGILKAAGLDGKVYSGSVRGDSIIWPQSVASVVSKPSGEIAQAGDSGPLNSIVLSDAGTAIATALCINTDTARILDKDAPLLDDGVHLTTLAKAVGVNTAPSGKVLEKHYLNVPYSEKEEAKALGARWDVQKRSWYVYTGIKDIKPFAKWDTEKKNQLSGPNNAERIYLSVPWSERFAAKKYGAIWDPKASSWYAGPKADLNNLTRWLPENADKQQAPAMSPKEEFTEALKALGCVVSGEHPIMDGKTHRIKCENDKTGEMAGFYIGHLDGHPAGYIKNNRTGVETKWKAKGYNLSPQQKAALRAEASDKLALRATNQKSAQEAAALRVNNQIKGLTPVINPTPYLLKKGVNPESLNGIFTDKFGKKTYVPIFDSDGKIQSMQYIQEDGTKRFAKNSRTEGCFHPIGGMPALEKAPVLLLAEGYATAASLSESLGQSVVCCFNSGNLVNVAKELNAKYPDKPVLVAGDDDRFLEMTNPHGNPGRKKAEEAAALVGGKAIFPVFSIGEIYPKDLEPVTPQLYQSHLQYSEAQKDSTKKGSLSPISQYQLESLYKIKSFSDFNDLATRSSLGVDGLKRQVQPEVKKVLKIANDRKRAIALSQPLEKRHRAHSL